MPRAPATPRQAAARRDRILDAAAEVLAERGFQGATVRRIARRAGLADGTIYNYFADKEALLSGLLDRLQRDEQRKLVLGTRSPDDLRAVVEAWVEHRLAPVWEASELLRAVLPALLVKGDLRRRYREESLEPGVAALEGFLHRLRDSGRIRRELDVRAGARAVTALILGLVILGLLEEDGVSRSSADLVTPVADLLLEGLTGGVPDPAQ